MLQSSVIGNRPIYCLRHKNEPATHLCVDTKCTQNSVLCAVCFRDQVNRSYHYDHEKNILPYNDAINALTDLIKAQTTPVLKIYKSTIGRHEFVNILSQVEKGQKLYQELEDKIVSIKTQVQLQLELLVKQFQRQVAAEKQQYFKLLDAHKKSFVRNMDFLKAQTQTILDFHNSVKYYSNKNSFYLKLNSETRKKSDWIVKIKKAIFHTERSIETGNLTGELTHILGTFQRLKMDSMPAWKGDENSNERINELKYLMKKAMGQWISIPDTKYLEDETSFGGSSSPQTLGAPKNYHF